MLVALLYCKSRQPPYHKTARWPGRELFRCVVPPPPSTWPTYGTGGTTQRNSSRPGRERSCDMATNNKDHWYSFRVILAILVILCCGCCLMYKFFRGTFNRLMPSSQNREGYVDDQNKFNEYPQPGEFYQSVLILSSSLSTTTWWLSSTELSNECLSSTASELPGTAWLSPATGLSSTGLPASTASLLVVDIDCCLQKTGLLALIHLHRSLVQLIDFEFRAKRANWNGSLVVNDDCLSSYFIFYSLFLSLSCRYRSLTGVINYLKMTEYLFCMWPFSRCDEMMNKVALLFFLVILCPDSGVSKRGGGIGGSIGRGSSASRGSVGRGIGSSSSGRSSGSIFGGGAARPAGTGGHGSGGSFGGGGYRGSSHRYVSFFFCCYVLMKKNYREV